MSRVPVGRLAYMGKLLFYKLRTSYFLSSTKKYIYLFSAR